MKKVLVIAGPTASGKTRLSIELAKRYGCSIISGDSIQVYKGFDIGSGKIKEEEKEGIHHDLIDLLEPWQNYSVADFQRMAREIIDASSQMKIICGGTGLYLKACLYDYVFDESAPSDIPTHLLTKDNATLHAMIQAKDPRQAEKIHMNNRQRMLRCLSIMENSGKTKSDIEDAQEHRMVYDAFIVACTCERERLYAKINRRVEQMVADGLEQEVAAMLEKGVSFDAPPMKGIGYKEWQAYFLADQSLAETIAEIQKHSRQFAKRQYTWLNHQMPVHWLDMDEPAAHEKMLETIDAWRNDAPATSFLAHESV